MLPASHNRAYQDFLTLLTEFNDWLIITEDQQMQASVNRRFQEISSWFKEHIAELDSHNLSVGISSRWQSVQTEIKREFQLLSVAISFLSAARQKNKQSKRIEDVKQHIAKLIGYCQIMLNKNN